MHIVPFGRSLSIQFLIMVVENLLKPKKIGKNRIKGGGKDKGKREGNGQ